jgi:hypothetical protein
MNELIGRLVAHIWVYWAAAEKAVGISCNVLAKQGPDDKVRPPLASLPGAKTLMGGAASKSLVGMGYLMGGAASIGTLVR